MSSSPEGRQRVPLSPAPRRPIKNILVTGGAGFIGSHVVLHLVRSYPHYKIVNLDKLDYSASLKNLATIRDAPNYKFVQGDILSADLVRYLLSSEDIDTIVHFAAQSHVDHSFGNSFHFTRTNVLGTHVLLEAAKSHQKIQLFLHVSTDEVYGENEGDDALESKVLEPTNPYAASKAAAEAIVKSYHRSFAVGFRILSLCLPTVISRSNNVYGPHQYPEKLIPKFICRVARGLPCCVHGTGKNVRNYLYVQDVAQAFDLLIHKAKIGEVYNIGTDLEMSNRAVAEAILREFGVDPADVEKHIEHVPDRLFNDKRYAVDSSKLYALGWKPTTSWEKGLQLTKNWYLKNAEHHWDTLMVALDPHPIQHL